MLETVWMADTLGDFKLPANKRIAPDYYDIIMQPMDLKTVRRNLNKGSYEDEHAFKHVRSTSAVKKILTLSFSLGRLNHRRRQAWCASEGNMDEGMAGERT